MDYLTPFTPQEADVQRRYRLHDEFLVCLDGYALQHGSIVWRRVGGRLRSRQSMHMKNAICERLLPTGGGRDSLPHVVLRLRDRGARTSLRPPRFLACELTGRRTGCRAQTYDLCLETGKIIGVG